MAAAAWFFFIKEQPPSDVVLIHPFLWTWASRLMFSIFTKWVYENKGQKKEDLRRCVCELHDAHTDESCGAFSGVLSCVCRHSGPKKARNGKYIGIDLMNNTIGNRGDEIKNNVGRQCVICLLVVLRVRAPWKPVKSQGARRVRACVCITPP